MDGHGGGQDSTSYLLREIARWRDLALSRGRKIYSLEKRLELSEFRRKRDRRR